MKKTALIFGAGKTGRGFAAHLAFLGGYEIILIDNNRQLVDALNKVGQYPVQVLDNEDKSCTIKINGAYHVDDVSWHKEFTHTGLAFTAVFGNNLQSLAESLATAMQRRYIENPLQALTIITCENKTGAARFLKTAILDQLRQDEGTWLANVIGFSEAIIFRTCLGPAADQLPLTIRAQDFFQLPCDGDAVKGKLTVYGLRPLKNFTHQLTRKIYTYNCINAIIAYLGAAKGYTQLYEAGNDGEIIAIAEKAASESSRALMAEFGFDPEEQAEWTKAAFAKFRDKNIPDPIERNAADPVRKLDRDDRLIGPALLALKHGIYPEGLLEGIVACFAYTDPATKTSMTQVVKEKGLHAVLSDVCGLAANEPLFTLICEKIEQAVPYGR